MSSNVQSSDSTMRCSGIWKGTEKKKNGNSNCYSKKASKCTLLEEQLARAESDTEQRATLLDRKNAALEEANRKILQMEEKLRSSQRALQKAQSERDDALMAARKAVAQTAAAQERLAHTLKKEVAAREKAEAQARKAMGLGSGANNVDKVPSAQSKQEFRQRSTFQEETISSAMEEENQQLRMRLKWVCAQVQNIMHESLPLVRDQAWQLPVADIDKIVVPAVEKQFERLRSFDFAASMSEVGTLSSAGPASTSSSSSWASLAEGRKQIRALEKENSALRMRISDLLQRIDHQDQMIDYAATTTTSSLPPAASVSSPLQPLDVCNSNNNVKDDELFEFFAHLSPMRNKSDSKIF